MLTWCSSPVSKMTSQLCLCNCLLNVIVGLMELFVCTRQMCIDGSCVVRPDAPLAPSNMLSSVVVFLISAINILFVLDCFIISWRFLGRRYVNV